MKRDIRMWLIGIGIGVGIAMLILVGAYLSALHHEAIHWFVETFPHLFP